MIGEQPEKEEQPEREVPRKKTQEVEVEVAAAGFLRFKIRPLFLFYNKTGWLVTGEAVCV